MATEIEPDAVVDAAVAVGACEDCARLVVALVVGAGAEVAAPAIEASDLTERERTVLTLLGTGLSATQIGTRLDISAATVRKHLEHLYTKLGVHDRLAAVVRARELDVVDADILEPDDGASGSHRTLG